MLNHATGSDPARYFPWILAPFGMPGSAATSALTPSVWWAQEARVERLEACLLLDATASGLMLKAWNLLCHEATGGWTIHAGPPREHTPALSRSPAEMLAVVRAHLAPSIVETAFVLGVERPTIYAWMSGRSEPHERNRRRLHELFGFAMKWSRLSPSPLGVRLRHPDERGVSIVDLLRSNRFEEAGERLGALARLEAVATEAPRAASVRSVLARHGLEERVRPNSDEVDRLSGKRIAPG